MSGLKNKVSSSNNLNDSSHWQSRHNVEWSVVMESEPSVDSSGRIFLLLVEIEDVPSLVGTIMSVINLNVLTFGISCS